MIGSHVFSLKPELLITLKLHNASAIQAHNAEASFGGQSVKRWTPTFLVNTQPQKPSR